MENDELLGNKIKKDFESYKVRKEWKQENTKREQYLAGQKRLGGLFTLTKVIQSYDQKCDTLNIVKRVVKTDQHIIRD